MTKRTRDDSHERIRARADNAMAEIRGMHKRSRGYTRADAQAGAPAVANPAPSTAPKADDAESVADSIRNAYKRRA